MKEVLYPKPGAIPREIEMDELIPLVVPEIKAARMLAVSVSALRRWRREGRGPAFVRVERCVRYRLSDLTNFVEAHLAVKRSNADQQKDKRGPRSMRRCEQ